MFSVEIVEGSEIFSSVAAAIRSTNEVLYHQPNVNEGYSVAWKKGMLKQKHVINYNFQGVFTPFPMPLEHNQVNCKEAGSYFSIIFINRSTDTASHWLKLLVHMGKDT